MNDEDLLLRLADLPLPPTPTALLDGARRRGHRRLRRRRMVLATAAAAVAAGAVTVPFAVDGQRGGARRIAVLQASPTAVDRASATATSVATVPRGRPLLPAPFERSGREDEGDVYAGLFTTPTRGDLADDVGYQQRALAAWQAYAGTVRADRDRGALHDLRRSAHVAWAGSTPAGPAAVIAQQAHARTGDPRGDFTAVGFVGVDGSGAPRVVAAATRVEGVVEPTSFVVDPPGRVVVVLDTGPGTGLAQGLVYRADGAVSRNYDEDLLWGDGAAVVTLGQGASATDARTGPVRIPDGHAGDQIAGAASASVPCGPDCITPTVHRLDWTGVLPLGTGAARDQGVVSQEWMKALYPLMREPYSGAFSLWFADGTTPDGRRVTVGDWAVERDPSHAVAVLTGPAGHVTTVGGGAVDQGAALPVHVRLPDAQGWVVAAKGGTIRGRSGTGPWSAPATDAALLPDATTQVEVVRGQGGPAVVELPQTSGLPQPAPAASPTLAPGATAAASATG